MRRAFTIAATAAALLLAAASAPAHAFEQVFWEEDALLAELFPGEVRFTTRAVEVDRARARALRSRFGSPVPPGRYVFRLAWEGERLLGLVLVDEQVGQHEPITFAVQLDPTGAVVREEILVYREKYGHQVRDPRFARQFVGLTADDPLRPGRDVDVVTGATRSSVALTVGVRRATVLARVLLEEMGRLPAPRTDGT